MVLSTCHFHFKELDVWDIAHNFWKLSVFNLEKYDMFLNIHTVKYILIIYKQG